MPARVILGSDTSLRVESRSNRIQNNTMSSTIGAELGIQPGSIPRIVRRSASSLSMFSVQPRGSILAEDGLQGVLDQEQPTSFLIWPTGPPWSPE